MKPERLNIRKEILIWAVERNGQSVEEYAQKNPSFNKWIEGEKMPTIKQLEGFATQVHVPFGYLFLNERPQEFISIPFFRTIDRQPKFNLKLYDTVIDLQRKQDWLSSYLRENEMNIHYAEQLECYRNEHLPSYIFHQTHNICQLEGVYHI